MASGSTSDLQALKGWTLPPRVVRVLGDPRFRLEGPLLALHNGPDETTWTVEEPGILRQWTTKNGRELLHQVLSDLEMMWTFGGATPRLVSAADDLTFWDSKTGAALKTVKQPTWVTALAFRADGSALATGHDDGRVRVWDASNGKLIREWREDQTPVSALSFTPDGQRLAAAMEDRKVYLFDTVHGLLAGKLEGHTDRISGISWHPSTRYLVTSSWDTTARLWDVRGEPLFILNGQADQVNAVAFSPDGAILASADSAATIWLWEPFHGKVLQLLKGHVGEVNHLAFTADGKHLLSGGSDGRLILWNVNTGDNVLHTSGDSTYTSRVRLSPSQKQVAAILGGRSIFLWDTDQGKRLGSIEQLPSQATAISYPTHNGHLASGHEDGRILFWNTSSLQVDREVREHTSRVTALAVDPAFLRLASGGSVDGYVYLWALDRQEPLLLIPGATEGCTVEALAFLPNSSLLIAAGVDWRSSGQEGALCVWDVDKPTKLKSLPTGGTALAARPEGNQFALATLTDSICLYSKAAELQQELIGHAGMVTSLAYTSDGKHLLSSGDDGTVRVWDAATGEQSQVLETDVSIRDLSITTDGRFVYTANANATAFVIDLNRA
jgi:WD40 repeat protein